ncbi:MAG: recombinase family protein [Sphingobium sp.]|nr:recombinase family protein [Sphingobium sp.]
MNRKSDQPVLRCAIYTRKSTEEGLEQAFNSLDAQREACAAYIMSQTHEGWRLVPDLYNDGGYSGGNMARPGLVQLMADVQAGKVDVIVVYKVDRLTRSLADFAKIVEVLDKHGASFVSVTQAFNTTSSMGRLTLNVLLSFAQFEREVTGERIRDKIAASKARGMWMGGVVPLGYKAEERKLIPIEDEAERVRHIFSRYLDLGSVYALQAELAENDIRTKTRVGRDGKVTGNAHFSRGALYQMLRNRIYVGEIVHRGVAYPGDHDAIVERSLFEQVGVMLYANRVDNADAVHAEQPSLLSGMIWDSEGRRMLPNHATKRGVRYRYYASAKDKERLKLPVWRIPAGELEGLVMRQLARSAELMPETSLSRQDVRSTVERVIVHRDRVEIVLTPPDEQAESIIIPATLISRSGEKRLSIPDEAQYHTRPDAALVKLIVRAFQARQLVEAADAHSLAVAADKAGVSSAYLGVLLRLSYLAPDIVAAIIDGRQPPTLNRQRLARVANLPLDWRGQREVLGFT